MKRLITSYEYGQTFVAPILVKDFQDKITNDDINDVTYGPNIDRTYEFEMNLDNSEWALQQMGGKRMSDWVKQFVEALKYEQQEKTADIDVENVLEDEDITAEININDLPTIVWNDEEYRVLFNDDGTAEILNDFGNHIMQLEGTSIEDINKQLGDQQIVTSKKNRLSNKLKRFSRLANEISEDLLSIKQEYARYDNFNDEEFDAKMAEYEHMLESIKLTEEQINKEHSIDFTNRKKEYFARPIGLNDNDSKMFRDTICPNCENSTLVKTNKDDKYQYIECEDCGYKYKVDLENGEIFYIGE